MGWIVVAVALAGVVPGTRGGQEPGVAHRAGGPPDAPPPAVGCEAAGLARQGHDALLRLCMPGDPLVLRASYRWEPDLPSAREGVERQYGWKHLREGEPPLDGPRNYRAGDDGGASTGEDGDGAGSCADGACATTTPEPVTLLLLGSGLAGVAGARYRKRRHAD